MRVTNAESESENAMADCLARRASDMNTPVDMNLGSRQEVVELRLLRHR